MAFGPITSWQIEGERVEAVPDFLFLGSKIPVDGECSHEIKRQLILGKKSYDKTRQYVKSKDITLSTKVHIIQAIVFLVVMYGCDSWTIKKAEHQRIDGFELCVGQDS